MNGMNNMSSGRLPATRHVVLQVLSLYSSQFDQNSHAGRFKLRSAAFTGNSKT